MSRAQALPQERQGPVWPGGVSACCWVFSYGTGWAVARPEVSYRQEPGFSEKDDGSGMLWNAAGGGPRQLTGEVAPRDRRWLTRFWRTEPGLGGGRPRGAQLLWPTLQMHLDLTRGRSGTQLGFWFAHRPGGSAAGGGWAGPVESDQVLGGPAAGRAGCSPALGLYVSKYL